MHPTLALLVGLRARITRADYLRWGFGLAIVKFALDTSLVYFATHKIWSPLAYAVPSLVFREHEVGPVPEGIHVALALLALPFLWIGLTMSVRRAADAGRSPWLGVGFLVPFLNYLTIAYLSFLPTEQAARWEPSDHAYRAGEGGVLRAPELPLRLRAALQGLLACMALGLAMVALSVYGLGVYGTALFFLTPFAVGATSAAVYNARAVRPLGLTLSLAAVGTVLTGSVLLLFAIEGLVCLAMAFPIALALSAFGAVVGRAIVLSQGAHARGGAWLLVLPAIAGVEARAVSLPVHDVETSIEIAAPPEAVWPHVIGFTDLPEPPAWEYKLGIAYPMRARIDGEGVGAIRRCEFSTGPFVEPITAWEPPRRLAFDVTSQPPSMTEWSPYSQVHAPHIEGYFKSVGGEFRLVPLAGGRTRLEGTTHYTMAIEPEIYWRGFAELLLHGIHTRVLRHIKALSEGDARE